MSVSTITLLRRTGPLLFLTLLNTACGDSVDTMRLIDHKAGYNFRPKMDL